MKKFFIQKFTLVSLMVVALSGVPQEILRAEMITSTSAQDQTDMPQTISLQDLQANINKIIDANKGSIDAVGADVVDEDGNTLFHLNEDKLFPPASNLKLYVSALALDRLGPDFRTRTSVYAPSLPDADGTIRGDVVLYGRGEYNLSIESGQGDRFRSLEDLADQLKAKGVKKIEGNIVGDDSYFRASPVGKGVATSDLEWDYGAEVTALSIHDNAFQLKIIPGAKIGDKAIINTDPASPLIVIANRTTTTPAGTQKKIELKKLNFISNVFIVTGSIPLNGEGESYNLAMHNPTLFAADFFRNVLAQKGIQVKGSSIAVNAQDRLQKPFDPSKQVELAFLNSIPLRDELSVMNKSSNNVHAELLIRQVGLKLANFLSDKIEVNKNMLPNSVEMGIIGIQDLLDRIGIDYKPLQIADGSGLSEEDYVTPTASLILLRFMAKMPTFDLFMNSLPIAGVDGTLKKRFMGTKVAGNLHAKTGTLDNVNALSGYLFMPNGKKIFLSFMLTHTASNVNGNKLIIDPIVNLLAEYASQK